MAKNIPSGHKRTRGHLNPSITIKKRRGHNKDFEKNYRDPQTWINVYTENKNSILHDLKTLLERKKKKKR